LLCDNCNWEFTGFAVPGTVSAKPTKNPKKKQVVKISENSNKTSKNSENGLSEKPAGISVSPENSPVSEFSPREINIDNQTGSGLISAGEKAKRKSGV
jgi:hypothetical protein